MSTQFVQPTIIPLLSQMPLAPPLVKFDAAFLERRMRQHRDWQKREAWKLCVSITREVLLLDSLEEADGGICHVR
jgi:hypothetical protein